MAQTKQTTKQTTQPAPQIVRVPIASLVEDPKNPRVHGEKNLRAIADSLARFGQVEPILIEKKTRKIIGGHGRVRALRDAGETHALVLELPIGGKDARALAIALNRTGDLAEYDEALLREALDGLEVPGFDADDIEAIVGSAEEDDEPLVDPGPQGETRVRILVGDNRARLRDLEANSVQCCVTSPPYFGLRDYGTASWSGGDPACEHRGTEARTAPGDKSGQKQATNVGSLNVFSGDCRCGAKRVDHQIGLEKTIDEYVAALVDVFREVRRVLRDDGVLWLNLGDSYASTLNGVGFDGLKEKDLIGIPWRVAFALQRDGWFLRSDVIWAKPNPMPESVTDRPTKSHEYVFFFSKSASYFYDIEAIREPISPSNDGRVSVAPHGSHVLTAGHRGQTIRKYDEIKGANARTVWTISPEPTAEAHFATYPTKLVERCLLAGTKEGDVVLDPFFGAGTTGLVAARLKRSAIGCELNMNYAKIASRRIHSDDACKVGVDIDAGE